jgi:heat shock protein HslJ
VIAAAVAVTALVAVPVVLLTRAPRSTVPGAVSEIEGVWLLESYDLGDGIVHPATGPWIEIGPTSVMGDAGCNDFGTAEGTLSLVDGVLDPGDGYITASECLNGGMTLEHVFTGVMGHPDGVRVSLSGDNMNWTAGDTTLVFSGSDSPPSATPRPSVPDTISEIARFWVLASFDVGEGSVKVEPGANTAHRPWIEIEVTSIKGNGGCNDFRSNEMGTISLDDGVLTTGDVFRTDGYCVEGEQDLMAVELAFLGAMDRPDGMLVTTNGERMTWSTGGMRLVFSAKAAPPSD